MAKTWGGVKERTVTRHRVAGAFSVSLGTFVLFQSHLLILNETFLYVCTPLRICIIDLIFQSFNCTLKIIKMISLFWEKVVLEKSLAEYLKLLNRYCVLASLDPTDRLSAHRCSSRRGYSLHVYGTFK